MSFMEPEIFEDSYFEVDTADGTEIVPCSVCGIYTKTVRIEQLQDYLSSESDPSNHRVSPQHGWVCRMSAPGYMDCTPWAACKSEQECKDYLDEMYGGDDE